MSKLNGLYTITEAKGSYRTLSYALLLDDRHGPYNAPDSVRLKIDILDMEHMRVTLLEGERILKTRTLKGRPKDSHFVLKERFRYKPWLVVVSGFSSSKARIGLYPEGDLKVDVACGGCGLLVVFPFFCADDQLYDLRFARLK